MLYNQTEVHHLSVLYPDKPSRFILNVMCLVAKCFSRATLLWLIEEGKYRRQNQRQHLSYNQVKRGFEEEDIL